MKPDRVITPTPAAVFILAEVSALKTLSDVLSWGRSRHGGTLSPLVITDVIIQDEFTHDAIVPITETMVAVFGST